MGLGVQVDEEAATDAGHYDEIFAYPRDDEAPLVWGYRRRSCWSRTSLDNRILLIGILAFSLVVALLTGAIYYDYARSLPSFSVRLALHEGGSIEPARPGSVVSSAFRATLSMTKACADRAEVGVAYAGVALGWARAEPMDCAGKRWWGRDVEVLARGDGVGLSRGHRDRIAAEWEASGTLELDVDVRVFDSSDAAAGDLEFPQVVMSCKVRLGGRGSESESVPLAWHWLSLFTYD